MKKSIKKYCLIIKSLGSEVKVASPKEQWIKALKCSGFLKEYIPNCEILESNKKSYCTLVLKVDRPQFSLKFPKAIYSNLRYDEKDIVSIIEFLLERLRQENGYYCMHSSSIILKDKGIIFWGWASGIGKTRLVLHLSKNPEAQFFSDEKTLIDLQNKIMLGGLKYAYLSKHYFRHIYQNKKVLNFIVPSLQIKIAFLVYPQVSESKRLFIEEWSPEKLEWHLYEELSRKIRATSRRLFNNSLPVASLDTPALSKKRSLDVKRFVKSIHCYYMCGTEDQISKKLLKLMT